MLERFTLLVVLFSAGASSDDLLGHFHLSAASAVYSASLGLMVLATLRAAGLTRAARSSGGQTPAGASLQPGLPTIEAAPIGPGQSLGGRSGGATAWHTPTTFTDPLFQLPAVLCTVMVLAVFVRGQVAEPPQSLAGLLILGGFSALGITTTASIVWRRTRTDPQDGARAVTEATDETTPASSLAGTFSDPWFSVPGFLAVWQAGAVEILESLEGGTLFSSLGIVLAAVAALVAFVKLSEIRKQRKDKRAAANGGPPAAGATSAAEHETSEHPD